MLDRDREPETRVDQPRSRRLWLWFLAGFWIVFGTMVLVLNTAGVGGARPELAAVNRRTVHVISRDVGAAITV